MDFFQNQDDARKRSKRLVILFLLAVVGVCAAVYFAAAFAVGAANGRVNLWNPDVLVYAGGITLAIIAIGSLYKTSQLSGGGASVATMLGGQPVNMNTQDPAERKLMNVVEEMAIASGVPVPSVYIMNGEQGINAFAAGDTAVNSVIGVTRGCIEKLNRDELQGVIAHEFSHILNGDCKLNVRLIGVLHGILVIGILGGWLMRSSIYGRGRRDGRAVLAMITVGLSLLIIGYVGVFFGNLIKSAVSRQREFLADSSAVQFTRNPNGIAGALKKIGGFSEGARLTNRHTEEASHMFFGHALRKRALFGSMLATHPPLEQRIKAIDPTFDGTFPKVENSFRASNSPISQMAGGHVGGSAATPSYKGKFKDFSQNAGEISATPEQLVADIGAPRPEHVSYSAALLGSFPDEVRSAARTLDGARALIHALLLDPEESIRLAQFAQLKKNSDPGVVQAVQGLALHVESLGARARLPIIDLSLGALRQMTPEQYHRFGQNVDVMIRADQKVTLFEYTLQKILMRHLGHFFRPHRVPVNFRSPKALAQECVVLISVLAYAGHDELDEAEKAFEVAIGRLALAPTPPAMASSEAAKMTAFDYALGRINQSDGETKRKVLDACAYCVAADGKVTIEEAEMLRAVADSLGCPMPPFLA